MGSDHPVAVNFFSKSVFARGLKLPNWRTSEKKRCTSVIARVSFVATTGGVFVCICILLYVCALPYQVCVSGVYAVKKSVYNSSTTAAVFQVPPFVPLVTVYVGVVGAQRGINPWQHFHVECIYQTHRRTSYYCRHTKHSAEAHVYRWNACVPPFSTCDAAGISNLPHPEGEPWIVYKTHEMTRSNYIQNMFVIRQCGASSSNSFNVDISLTFPERKRIPTISKSGGKKY